MDTRILLIFLVIPHTLFAQDWKSQPGYPMFIYEGEELLTINQGEDIQFLLGTYNRSHHIDVEKYDCLHLVEGGSGRWCWPEDYLNIKGALKNNNIIWDFEVIENGKLKNFGGAFKNEGFELLAVYRLFVEAEHIPFGNNNKNWEYVEISHAIKADVEYLIVMNFLDWVKYL